MSEHLLEHALVGRLSAGLPRSPLQLNQPHESDAELVKIPEGPILAVTTDGIVEEIASGLYDDPYEIGWMTVTVSASDLAAVGAEPIGLLVNVTLPPHDVENMAAGLARGVGDSARAHALPVLGGDTNQGASLQTSATAIGVVSNAPPLTRRGCAVGDLLFASGQFGLGSALALERLVDGVRPSDHEPYRPVARLREGRSLRGLAGCCIDTSDGLLAALDELMRRNRTGLRLTAPIEALLAPRALAAARAAHLPAWTLLAGPHGEYELLFTVSPDRVASVLREAAKLGWQPLQIGEVAAEPALSLIVRGRRVQLDTSAVRNLYAAAGGDVEAFVLGLLRIDAALGGQSARQHATA